MTVEQAIKLLNPDTMVGEIAEKEAVARKIAIKALEKQIPKKVCFDNENGIYETEHCPTCFRRLMPNEHHCRCGQALDWNENAK